MSNQMTAIPTPEQIEELILSCRYGDIEDVKAFAQEFGWDQVASAKDERGNTVLHMCCGNGHVEILSLLISNLPPSSLSQTNEAGSPPIHWAVLNNHVACVKILAELPEEKGGGLPLLHQKNGAGRDAFHESIFAGEGKEEVSGWIEGFLYRAEGGNDEEGEEMRVSVGETEAVEGEGKDEAVTTMGEGKHESMEVDEKIA